MGDKVFCLDTSSLIWAMKSAYPIDVFPSFWSRLEESIGEGIVSIKPVYSEIE